jgi:hypothetical protein
VKPSLAAIWRRRDRNNGVKPKISSNKAGHQRLEMSKAGAWPEEIWPAKNMQHA